MRDGASTLAATCTQSNAVSVGRREKTSPATASMRSRIRVPPPMTARS
jgi:hypothetical protein